MDEKGPTVRRNSSSASRSKALNKNRSKNGINKESNILENDIFIIKDTDLASLTNDEESCAATIELSPNDEPEKSLDDYRNGNTDDDILSCSMGYESDDSYAANFKNCLKSIECLATKTVTNSLKTCFNGGLFRLIQLRNEKLNIFYIVLVKLKDSENNICITNHNSSNNQFNQNEKNATEDQVLKPNEFWLWWK
jgi:hypothetical protein